MAEAIVTGLLEKLGSLIAEGAWPELKLFLCLHEEVQKLKSTLDAIQAVLKDAEKRQVKEAAVKHWLDKLKEAAFDIDNVLDELETAMIKSKIQEEEEEVETTTATAKVWSCISCLSGLFVKLKELVHRRGIAHKIKKLNEKLDEIANERGTFGFQLGSISNEVVERPRTTSFVDVSHIIGREDHRGDLVNNLLGKGREIKRNPYVISIVGMGGIGKTTLAQLAYNDPEVRNHFEKKMWVCVSHPFDQCRVAKAIIEEGGGSTNSNELQGLHSKIWDLIVGKKFLLVLDDVWTENFTNDWEPLILALKNGAQGSSILVTTRNERVASMVHSDHTIRLELLSMEDCLSMFNKIAFADKNKNQCKQLTDLAEKLANKCKGLPLAAKILGSLMHNKTTRQDWEDILESNLWESEDVQKGLLGPLLLSYYEQPLAIKSCFLYCALFPKDYLFSRNELIYLWMAQGYLGVKPNIEMEIVGEEYFERLVMHSFFQDFKRDEDNKIIKCKMHDIVHDFAQSMTTNNEYVTINGDKELGTNCESTHHLRLELMWKTQFPMSTYNAKNVRTLFFTLRWGIVSPLDLFQHLICLRVLTLKHGIFRKLPNEVEKCIHLRLLDLSENCHIEELPETMCNLCNLQTLNISGCIRITKLPQGMGKLIKLRHLLIGYGYNLTEPFPKGVGRLRSLRTLEKFIIGGIDDSKGCKLGELKNLNHLKGSLTIEGLENVTDVQEAENAQLKEKKHLRELRLSFSFDEEVEEIESVRNDEIVLKALEPHPNLEILRIDDCMGRVYPNWMKSLSNLKRLVLWTSPNLEQLPPLGKLPLLETLELTGVNSVKKVGIEFLGIEEANGKNGSTSPLVFFPNLKSLQFVDMFEWEEWDGMGERREAEEGESGDSVLISIMPRLQFLDIWECPKLKGLPKFLETTSLKKLRVHCGISNRMTLATLSGLKTLSLYLRDYDVEHLPPLGKLLLLESLEIHDARRVKKVGVEFLGIEEESNNKIDDEKGSTSSSSSSSLVLFPNLKSLTFRELEEWEEWDGIGGTMREEEEAQESGVTITIMPRLQDLLICLCPKLKSLPDFLPTTPLKNLEIVHSPILSECCKAEIGDQWPKISHIPNIRIDYNDVRRDDRPMQT